MADPKTSRDYHAEIEYFESVGKDTSKLQEFVATAKATTLVSNARAGRRLSEAQSEGGYGRARSKAERNARWKAIALDIKRKNPDMLIKQITPLLLDEIANEETDCGRIPNDQSLAKLVGRWLREDRR